VHFLYAMVVRHSRDITVLFVLATVAYMIVHYTPACFSTFFINLLTSLL